MSEIVDLRDALKAGIEKVLDAQTFHKIGAVEIAQTIVSTAAVIVSERYSPEDSMRSVACHLVTAARGASEQFFDCLDEALLAHINFHKVKS